MLCNRAAVGVGGEGGIPYMSQVLWAVDNTCCIWFGFCFRPISFFSSRFQFQEGARQNTFQWELPAGIQEWLQKGPFISWAPFPEFIFPHRYKGGIFRSGGPLTTERRESIVCNYFETVWWKWEGRRCSNCHELPDTLCISLTHFTYSESSHSKWIPGAHYVICHRTMWYHTSWWDCNTF